MGQKSSGDPLSAISGGSRVAFFGGSFDPPHLGHLGVARAAQAALGLDTVLFAPVGTQPLKPQGPSACFEDRLAMTRLAIAAEPAFALSLADAPKSSGAPNYTLESLLAIRALLPPESVLFCLMGADSFASFNRWHRAAEIPFIAPLIVASRPGQLLHNLDSALPQGLTIEPAPVTNDLTKESIAAFHPSDNDSSLETPALKGHGFSCAVEAKIWTGALAPVRLSADEIALRRYILRNPSGRQAPFYLLPGLHIDINASDIRAQIRNQAQPAAQTPDQALLPPSVFEYIRSHNLYR
jgi:nicotinate-nucleotide adenylyltransferase